MFSIYCSNLKHGQAHERVGSRGRTSRLMSVGMFSIYCSNVHMVRLMRG